MKFGIFNDYGLRPVSGTLKIRKSLFFVHDLYYNNLVAVIFDKLTVSHTAILSIMQQFV